MVQRRGPFARESTGLVRELSAGAVFSMNFAYLGPAAGITYPLIFAPYLLGSDWTTAALLGGVLMLPVVLMYFYLSRLVPRSAGDYVYISRSLGGTWGMIQVVTNVFVFASGTAILAQSELPLVVSPALQALGASFGDPSLISVGNALTYSNIASPLFFGSTLFIIGLATFVTLVRTRWFSRILFGLALLQIVSTLIMVAALLAVGSEAAYSSKFDAVSSFYGGPSYASLASQLSSRGFSVVATLALMATIMGFFYLYNNAPTYFAGEVKRAEKNLVAGLIYSYVAATILGVVLAFELQHIVGESFYDYTSINGWDTSSGAGIPITPTSLLSYVAILLLQNKPLLLLAVGGALTWYFLYCIIDIAIPTRVVFALSFDRLMPKAFSRVSDTLHSPYVAGLFVFGLTVLFDYLETFAGFSTNGIVQYGINFMLWEYLLAAVAAIYIARKGLGGLVGSQRSGLTALGAVSAVVLVAASGILIVYGVLTYSSTGFGGALFAGNLPLNLATIVGLPVAGTLLYRAVKTIRSREGLDVSTVFKEIPPE